MATTMGILDSSALATSCSSFKPSPVQNGTSVRSTRRMVKCSCSKQDESSSSRRTALTRLVATGLALTVSTSTAFAAQPTTPVNENVGQKADKLLKDADKLINEDSPTRYGPSRGGSQDGNGRIAQQGGSGAIPDLQGSGSELVSKARDNLNAKAEETKENLGGSIQGKGEEVKKGIQGFFGQAQDKVTSDVDTVKKGSNDPSDKVKGLVGDARNKVKDNVDNTKDNAEGVLGSIKKGLNIK